MKEREIDLIVLDMIMDPGMDGLDTYKSVLAVHPKQKAIIVSGFSKPDRVHDAQSLGAGAYVRKPYIKENLGLAVRKELDRKNRQRQIHHYNLECLGFVIPRWRGLCRCMSGRDLFFKIKRTHQPDGSHVISFL